MSVIANTIRCKTFPCEDVDHTGYAVPTPLLSPEDIRLVLVSECAPPLATDNYYQGRQALYERTTLASFGSAGLEADSLTELLGKGIYCTNAVKCTKIGYNVPTAAIKECSLLLERELALFPKARALLLMGDVAIKALCAIARRHHEPRPIPAGSTYKIRGGEFWFRDARAFPSYLQAGASYGIEKSKVAMIAEDIAAALSVAGIG